MCGNMGLGIAMLSLSALGCIVSAGSPWAGTDVVEKAKAIVNKVWIDTLPHVCESTSSFPRQLTFTSTDLRHCR